MDNYYRFPITKEYEVRGCKVSINAAANSDSIDIEVVNLKTNYGISGRYVFPPWKNPQEWYSKEDIHQIQNMIYEFLDQYGDEECNETHFTNQILS